MAVLAPWLLPVRASVVLVAVLVAIFFANAATLGWDGSADAKKRKSLFRLARAERGEAQRLVGRAPAGAARAAVKPDAVRLPRWRRWLGLPVLGAVRLVLCGMGFWILEVEGQVDSEAKVLVCNHLSMIEPLVLLYLSQATPVAASDFERLPALGPVGRLLQLLWLDRGDVDSRATVVSAINSRVANDSKQQWPPVLVFPEGTTLNGRALIAFKTGAFAPAAPVQPCVASFPHTVRKGCGLDCSWTTAGPQFGELCVRMMLQPWNRVRVEFLETRFPNAAESADAALFAANVRGDMARALDVPTTEHSWADMWLNMIARDLGEPPHKTLVELGRLRGLLGRGYARERAVVALRRFADADGEKRGRLDLQQFRAALGGGALGGNGAQSSPGAHSAQGSGVHSTQGAHSAQGAQGAAAVDAAAVDALFASLADADGGGSVDFFQFLCGFALLDSLCDAHHGALRLVFALLDTAGDGRVPWAKAESALFDAPGDAVCDDSAFISGVPLSPRKGRTDSLDVDEFVNFVAENRHRLREAWRSLPAA